jgi:la-related protein 1
MPGMMGGAGGMDIQALQRQMQAQGVALPMIMPGMMPMMPYGMPYPMAGMPGGMPGQMPGGKGGGYGMPGLMQPPGHFGVPGLGMDRAELEDRIKQQLEYYFSEENLRKDTYLRDQLDAGGWAELALICGFKRLASLLLCTNDQAILFHSLAKSTLLELDNGRSRIRRKDGFRGVGVLPASSSSVGN